MGKKLKSLNKGAVCPYLFSKLKILTTFCSSTIRRFNLVLEEDPHIMLKLNVKYIKEG